MAVSFSTYRGAANRRPRLADLPKLLTALWGGAGSILCVGDTLQTWVSTTGLLMLSQAFCAIQLMRRYRVVRYAVVPDLLTIFLIFKLIDDVVTLLGVLVQHSRFTVAVTIQNAGLGANWIDVADAYQAQAELAFLAATVVMVATWAVLERGRIVALWHEPASRNVWVTYAVSCITYFVLPGSLGQTRSLTGFFSIGALAVLLGGQSRFAFGKRDSICVYIAMLPLLADAFRSGMKGNVLLVLIPILLPMFRRLNAHRIAWLGVFLAFVLLIVFPFSQIWRDANWSQIQGRQPENIGLVEAGRRVAEQWQTKGVIETSVTSTAAWLSRGSSAQAGGLVMQIADEDGYLGPVLLQGLVTIFIPRFLWPDKPIYAPGAWFSWYLGIAESPESAKTATAMMLPTELYWEFGALGVLLGMALITAILFFCWMRLLKGAETSVISIVALFTLAIQGSGVQGMFAIYAISGPLILLIYVLVFRFLHRLVAGKRRLPPHGVR